MVEPGFFIRLAIAIVGLLFKAACYGRTRLRVDLYLVKLQPLFHRVDPIFDGRIRWLGLNYEPRLCQQTNIGLAGINRAPGAAASIWVNDHPVRR